jgi:hypothetical protein
VSFSESAIGFLFILLTWAFWMIAHVASICTGKSADKSSYFQTSLGYPYFNYLIDNRTLTSF